MKNMYKYSLRCPVLLKRAILSSSFPECLPFWDKLVRVFLTALISSGSAIGERKSYANWNSVS